MNYLSMLMCIVVSVVLMCSIQQTKSFLQHLNPSRSASVSPHFAASTQKPARSYEVETMAKASFSNLQNLKKAKGMGDANQLPELEKLSESELLNQSPTMDSLSR